MDWVDWVIGVNLWAVAVFFILGFLGVGTRDDEE